MTRPTRPLALAIVLTVLPAIAVARQPPPSPGKPADDPVLARGATLYRIHCASCHGSKGAGDGPVASALRTKPTDLTSLAQRAGGKFPEEKVHSTIDGRTAVAAHGARDMPVWGLSFAEPGRDAPREDEIQAEIRALVRYVASIQRVSASAADGAP